MKTAFASVVIVITQDAEVAETVRSWSSGLFSECIASSDRDAVWASLVKNPQAIVFWDLDFLDGRSAFSALLATAAELPRVFAFSTRPIYELGDLLLSPCFGHFLVSVPNFLNHPLLLKVMQSAAQPAPEKRFGVTHYFPSGTKVQSITVKHSSEKKAAVEAVQSFLAKLGLSERIATLAAQGTDELLMNAIFDAPMNNAGKRFRRGIERSDGFALNADESVVLEVAACGEYAGIGVSDSYGSFSRDTLMRFLARNYSTGQYSVWKNDPGAGLGLYHLAHSGLSMVFLSHPGKRTEVQLYFKNTKKYREFREDLRLTTVLLPLEGQP